MSIIKYIQVQVGLIPAVVYVIVLIVLMASAVILTICKSCKYKLRVFYGILLIEYIFMILGTTVIFRKVLRKSRYNYTPFWSYQENRNELFLPETIVNISMFVPVGLLLCTIFKKISWRQVLIVGSGISFSIEILQYVFNKGFSEFDDVFHNTLGCMVGYLLYRLIEYLVLKNNKNRIYNE